MVRWKRLAVGPVVRREEALGEAGFVAHEIFDEGFAIGGVGEGLTDFAFGRMGSSRLAGLDSMTMAR